MSPPHYAVDPTFYLFGAALLAVVVSNTGLAPYYFAFLNLPINFPWETWLSPSMASRSIEVSSSMTA